MSARKSQVDQAKINEVLPAIVVHKTDGNLHCYLRTQVVNSHGELEVTNLLLEEGEIVAALSAHYCSLDRGDAENRQGPFGSGTGTEL